MVAGRMLGSWLQCSLSSSWLQPLLLPPLTLEPWLLPDFLQMGLLVKGTPSGQPSGLKPSTSHSRSPNSPSTGLRQQCSGWR
jgi:hypothetical protein